MIYEQIWSPNEHCLWFVHQVMTQSTLVTPFNVYMISEDYALVTSNNNQKISILVNVWE